jgi:hypothetical protein
MLIRLVSSVSRPSHVGTGVQQSAVPVCASGSSLAVIV